MPEGSLTSPEGILMLLVAAIIDIVGLILLCLSWLGVDDYGILDTIGLVIIGGWMFFRSGKISGTKGAQKVGKKVFKKLGLTFLVEVIPFLGSAAPCWVVAVYSELKNSEKENKEPEEQGQEEGQKGSEESEGQE